MSRANARDERYRRGKAAQKEVDRRLTLAIDRLRVAIESGGGNPAQFLHAVHYIQRGWADDSRIVPREAPDVHISQGEAEAIALKLHGLLQLATNTRSTFGEAE